jgi:hypothetical protein
MPEHENKQREFSFLAKNAYNQKVREQSGFKKRPGTSGAHPGTLSKNVPTFGTTVP